MSVPQGKCACTLLQGMETMTDRAVKTTPSTLLASFLNQRLFTAFSL